MDFIWFLVVGLAAGYLAGKFVKGSGFGLLGNLVVGGLGAILGGMAFGALGFRSSGGLVPSLIVAFVGALMLLWIARFFTKRR